MQSSQNIQFENILKSFKIYTKEAEACSEQKLYLAACILYGAALEAVLLTYCLASLEDTDLDYPSNHNFRNTKLSELIEEFENGKIIKKNIAKKIREFRNLVHPYRFHCRLKSKKVKIRKKEFIMVKNKFNRIVDCLLINI